MYCIVPDLPEHGQSKEVKPFTINYAVEMISQLVNEHAHDSRAHFVGVSLGAQIIIQIMATHPELVDHAMISGTIIRRTQQTETILKLLDYAINVYVPVKDTEFFIKANMRTYNLPKDLFFKFKESTILIEKEGLKRVMTENMIFKLPNDLDKIEMPVLIMAGEKDYQIVKESSLDLMNIIPNAQGAVALKFGHLWNLESPELFNKVLRAWITDHNLPKNGVSFEL